jgi:hypothetical protein
MKTPSDELFSLIKSLNRYEKRHFKAFSDRTQGSAGYMTLFDAISSMDQYDEKELKAKLKKRHGPENLKRIKSYLQESILRFLEDYYIDYSVEIQIQRYLQRIEVLLEKRLFEMAWKVIAKAEKTALESENYNYLLIILDWKRKAMLRQADMPKMNQYLKEGFLTEQRVIEIYRNLVEYMKLGLQMDLIHKTRFDGPDEKTISALKDLLSEPLLKDPDNAFSDRAKGLYYSILGNILIYFPKSWEESNLNYKHAIGLFEEKSLFQNENARSYLGLINGLTTSEILLKRTKDLEVSVGKATKFFYSQPKKLQAGNLLNQYMGILINYISYLIEQFNLEQALSQSVSAKEFVDLCGNDVLYMVFYGNYAIISFLMEDYHTALKCINKILAKEKSGVRQDVLNEFKIYNLMVHFELGNEDILPSLARSSRRFLEKNHELNPADNLILTFFEKKVIRINNKAEQKEAFRGASSELGVYVSSNKAPFTQKHYSFVLDWMESKAENISFRLWSRKKRKVS